MSKKIFAALVLFSLITNNLSAHEIHEHKEMRKITVSGSATVSSAPDIATVNFAIITKELEFKDAREQNAIAASNVLNAVRKIDIPESNINLQSLNINEDRVYDHKLRKSILVGYKAQRMFKVTVDKSLLSSKETLSDKLAQVITAVVENGSNQLQSVEYSIKDTKALSNQALAEAIADAKTKAEIMLTPLAASLGAVQSLSEHNSGYRPTPFLRSYPKMAMMADAESSSIPEPDAYSEGDITVSSNVNVTFEIL